MQEADNDENLFFSQRAVSGMLAVREKMNKGRVMSLYEPCNTISAHLAKVSLNSTDPVYMVDGRYRRFSTREAARIQSFPDTFQLDSVSQGRQYKAIGNAVPPVMMWHISKWLQDAIEKSETIDFKEIKSEYPKQIVVNSIDTDVQLIEKDKPLLISYVKSDNIDLFLDGSARIYYTGKKFPSSVALNKLYYFMPYIKKKGVKDLYLIKKARVGTRKEGQPDNNPNDFRLVFEVEFIKQLFDDYKLIHLDIWNTYTDTILETVMD